MGSSHLALVLSLLLFILPASNATPHRVKVTTSMLETPLTPFSPTTFFEVTRPIPLPHTKPCSALLLRHDFASTYGKPPVTAHYRPPPHCPHLARHRPSRIVLEWSAACRGRQFDRIFGLWIGGVELLRSCTAEPRATGMVWSVKKDVTRYAAHLARPQTLAVYLGNIVDETYTGVYHVNISLHFYFSQLPPVPSFASPADLILPISRPIPPDDGLWFPIQNSTDVHAAQLAIPSNTYRAVLEVYISFHSQDEFWYTNPPNAYISANNLTDLPGNGPFRELTVNLDDHVVGAVWPFTVIYTGGVNPLLWRPMTGIGSFNLPSYDIEITPFLGKILDGKPHSFGFRVTDALDVWYVDANLHLWLDSKSSNTVGELIKHEAPNFVPSLVSDFKGLDGQFHTSASRVISSTGWVNSSHGKITTHFSQKFDFKNWMKFAANGTIQVVNQTIDFNYATSAKDPSSVLYSEQVFQEFPLYVYTGTTDEVNDTFNLVTNVSLGFNTNKFSGERSGFTFSSLRSAQNAEGYMELSGNLVTSGLGSTRQVYRYESTDGCYFRDVSSRNYTILHDELGRSCTEGSLSGFGHDFT